MSALITSGLELTLIGMGMVFAFLTLLVIVTTLMSRIVNKLTPAQPPGLVAPSPSAVIDDELFAVIAEALRQHRSRRL